jgi:hypothetical protein
MNGAAEKLTVITDNERRTKLHALEQDKREQVIAAS